MAQQQEKSRPKTGQQNPQGGKSRQGGPAGPGQSGQQQHTGQHRGDNPRTREEGEMEEDEE